MSLEWIITGIILLGAMAAGSISLWLKRRANHQTISDPFMEVKDHEDNTDEKS